jgi:hypothetical protein
MQVDSNKFSNIYNTLNSYDNKTQWIQFVENHPTIIVKPNWGERIINHIKWVLGYAEGPAKIAEKVRQFFQDNIEHMTAMHIAGITKMREQLFTIMEPQTRTAFSELIQTVGITVDARYKKAIDKKSQESAAIINSCNSQIDEAQAKFNKFIEANNSLAAANQELEEQVKKLKEELDRLNQLVDSRKALVTASNLVSEPIKFSRNKYY